VNAKVSSPLRVVIAGGGVAGLEAALVLRDLAGERVSTTLLAPEQEYVDQGITTITSAECETPERGIASHQADAAAEAMSKVGARYLAPYLESRDRAAVP
jgi:2-polyprenyl-6-methoxyphenol hydroxylase-like FAD-dependent oxidoreductase